MGWSQSICKMVITSAAFLTASAVAPACASTKRVPTPPCRLRGSKNMMAALTVAMPNPMGIINNASRYPFLPM